MYQLTFLYRYHVKFLQLQPLGWLVCWGNQRLPILTTCLLRVALFHLPIKTWLHFISEYSPRSDTRQFGCYVIVLRKPDGNLLLGFRMRPTNSRTIHPESMDGDINTSYRVNQTTEYFKVKTWVHAAVSVDFFSKEASIYLNGNHIIAAR